MRLGPILAILVALVLVACSGEHDPEVVSVSADDCSVCHTPEFQAATDPPHVSIFPTECALCHTNVAWQPATFTHASVSNRECVLCHNADYEGTTDPSHAGLYPNTCGDCHGTLAWKPAIGGEHPETAFPITDGPHKEYTCTECHDPNLGTSVAGENTDCVGCHTGKHEIGKMNDKHREVADYPDFRDMNGPNFCLLCHPNGRD
jgi:hypothetical protein